MDQVYFIQDTSTGHVKVGMSNNPRARLAKLQTGSAHWLTLLAAVPGDRDREHALHRELASKCVGGEWFAITKAQVMDIVERMELVQARERQMRLPLRLRRPMPISLPDLVWSVFARPGMAF